MVALCVPFCARWDIAGVNFLPVFATASCGLATGRHFFSECCGRRTRKPCITSCFVFNGLVTWFKLHKDRLDFSQEMGLEIMQGAMIGRTDFVKCAEMFESFTDAMRSMSLILYFEKIEYQAFFDVSLMCILDKG
ncbi:hypothetical protein PoB_006048900 [Plakobranchus ocellatus]|uniref:Uncharacterized protein n=1 Tax=Plakobranchus ocellatus TaxID=259542 RepID=A0AAV4CQ36_9GAST|nr:hypothetical protein PoB_006048900 [Plakobranchus ocellatus]